MRSSCSCQVCIFFKIFLMWTILKVFLEFATILLLLLKFFGLFFFLAVRHVACGTLVLGPPPALEGKVLTTRPPGSSQVYIS